jgi:putative ABC transport system permease protein
MDSLSMDDVKQLEARAEHLQYVSPFISVNAQVIAGGKNWNTSVIGASPDYLYIRNHEIAAGAFFNQRDVKILAKVAVLGKTTADQLFPDQNPLGKQIRIRNVPFQVIGLLAAKGQSPMGPDQDDIILAPSTTVLFRLSDGKTVRTIMASATTPEAINQAKEELAAILRSSHRLHPDQDDDFNVRDQTEINTIATTITGTLTILLSAIAGVSLLVGGIGIMNIMLVSVTERTREIGIRLAIGARPGDVLVQFLIEAVILSVIGGIIGILTGVGIAQLLSALSGLSVVTNPLIIAIAVVFAAFIGVFFGYYPAKKAANMNPIEALRFE